MCVWTCIVDTGSMMRVTMLLIVIEISDSTHQPCFRSIVMCPVTVPVDPTRSDSDTSAAALSREIVPWIEM